MDYREDLIRKFWSFFDQRQFKSVFSLLHENFQAEWKTTNEIFPSREALIQVNEDYPGNWRTIPERIELFEGGAVSIVTVYSEKTTEKYFATSFYEFKDNLICKIIEFWAEVSNPQNGEGSIPFLKVRTEKEITNEKNLEINK